MVLRYPATLGCASMLTNGALSAPSKPSMCRRSRRPSPSSPVRSCWWRSTTALAAATSPAVRTPGTTMYWPQRSVCQSESMPPVARPHPSPLKVAVCLRSWWADGPRTPFRSKRKTSSASMSGAGSSTLRQRPYRGPRRRAAALCVTCRNSAIAIFGGKSSPPQPRASQVEAAGGADAGATAAAGGGNGPRPPGTL
eukprot:COSAG04_NODE_9320_length_875_cov_0.876289_2_plen_196_part_00